MIVCFPHLSFGFSVDMDGMLNWNICAYIYWLVVWNMNFMTFHILIIIVPTD